MNGGSSVTNVLAAAVVGIGSLRENPLRTILSTLGVIIGVGALVSVLSLSDAMQRFVRGELSRTTDLQNLTIRAQTQVMQNGVNVPVRHYPVFTLRDLDDIQRDITPLRGAAMTLGGSARVTYARTGNQRQVNITAATAGVEQITPPNLLGGRLFTASEASHNAPVIVLSHLLASELAAERGILSLLGSFVRVHGIPMEVIGIHAAYKGERGYSATVPYAAASALLGGSTSLRTPTILLKAESVEDVQRVKRDVEDWLATRYRDWETSVMISTREGTLEQAMQGLVVMKLFLGALAGISLLVGGIGIMNIMLANVTERTREIGIRKAIGARARDIQWQFLTEAVAVSCFGSTAGVILGALISAGTLVGIRRWVGAEQMAFTMSPSTVLVAAAAAVAIGVIFGTYPARRAGRLSPIDAIRHE
ncbi:MAG TPA: ABC transporter permease [Gemmatimonas sp.]|uniref:ABC transporter permease n=1 Tax=Gemmatimonas sp. TaxID=1962908 RepID=UPI002ED92F5B